MTRWRLRVNVTLTLTPDICCPVCYRGCWWYWFSSLGRLTQCRFPFTPTRTFWVIQADPRPFQVLICRPACYTLSPCRKHDRRGTYNCLSRFWDSDNVEVSSKIRSESSLLPQQLNHNAIIYEVRRTRVQQVPFMQILSLQRAWQLICRHLISVISNSYSHFSYI